MDKWIQLQSADGLNNLYPVGKLDLLWQNANPTSAFTAQTLNIDLSNYDAVLFAYNGSGYQSTVSDVAREYNLALIDGKTSMFHEGTLSNIWGNRTATVNSDSIVFSNGRYSTPSSSTDNSYACVPKEIYGIKLETDDVR